MSTDVKTSDVKGPELKRRSSQLPRQEPTSDINELHARLHADPRFNPPTPSVWKRVALLILVVALFYFGAKMRANMARPQEEIIHAKRYSREYKFRPAASPIITEKLSDGRTKVRGAAPTFR